MSRSKLISANKIRSAFAQGLSEMYQREVPLYGDLLNLVQSVNKQVLSRHPEIAELIATTDSVESLSTERHGAIRLGSAQELFNIRRLFAVMDMHPVAYYDLSAAGLPVHSTAFRPITLEALKVNPFRVFTSLLRLDLLADTQLREKAQDLLAQRQIFSPGLMKLIEVYESNQGLDQAQADQFVDEALEIFRWHKRATVDFETYRQFRDTHPLVADIVCFKGPHLNHLTPRTLDIVACQQAMMEQSMNPKENIEGPPRRAVPILLRQTSFKALSEPVDFIQADGTLKPASHTARFGEIEQRGMALTPKGRQLYDSLLLRSQQVRLDTENHYPDRQDLFAEFPDDIHELHRQALGYFRYQVNTDDGTQFPANLEDLIATGRFNLIPLTYEDFLPVSAAGIFRSNLSQNESESFSGKSNQPEFERDLGCPVIKEFDLYWSIQQESLLTALKSSMLAEPECDQVMHQFKQLYR